MEKKEVTRAEEKVEKKLYSPRLEVLEARIAPMSAQGAAHISAQGAAHNQDPPTPGNE